MQTDTMMLKAFRDSSDEGKRSFSLDDSERGLDS